MSEPNAARPEVIDVESAPVRRGPRLAVPMAVLVLLALLAGGGWYLWRTQTEQQQQAQQQRLAQAQDQHAETIAQLRREQEALRGQAAELGRRLAVAEAAQGAPLARIEALERRLLETRAATEQAVAELRAQLAQRNREDPNLADKVAALDRAVAELNTLRAQASAQTGASALALAVAQLRDEVLSGRGYAPTLATVVRLAPDLPIAPALHEGATSGLPTRTSLATAFTPIPARLTALGAEPADGWWEQARRFMGRIISVRRTDPQGDGPEAVVARAEARLADNDLPGAVALLERLPEPQRQSIDAWLGAAQQRLAAERAVADLQRQAIEKLAGEARGG